jgi:hypothetical protein
VADEANHDALDELTRPLGLSTTDQWRLTINDVSSEVLQLQNNGMSHPGYMNRAPENLPPSFRIGMKVACSSLDPGAPTTTEIRANFLSFLGQPPVMDLVRGLTPLDDGLTWRARDDNPRHNFAAVLCLQDSEEAPAAWARLLVPEELTRQYGRDSRCAYFVLYVEPRSADGNPAPAATLVSWHQRLCGALKLPTALTEFLAGQLGLSTSIDPTAEVGVWLKAPRVLTELIDVDGYSSVQGSPQSNWYTGFATADPNGQRPDGLAESWLRQLCDSALHLDGYEADLASLRPNTGTGQRLTVKVLQQDFDVWRHVAYIVGIQVGITNDTDNMIRLTSIGIGSDWGHNPPVDMPKIDALERLDLQREADTRRIDRYAPELRNHSAVLPHQSICGWVVTWMPRPSGGGTPNMTLSIREAVGHQHRTVIRREDPQVYHSQEADTAVNEGYQSTPSAANVLAQRFQAEWATDISLFAKLKKQPSFQEVSEGLHRGSELGLISKHGIRAPLEATSIYLRIPHPDNWTSDTLIPLHLEERWLENILVHEWTPDQSFVDTFHSIAKKLRSTLRWEGEASYNPDATLDHFASLLLYGIETIRKGSSDYIDRIFQIVEDDWIITEWELIDKAHHYQILYKRFNEDDWVRHVNEKTWVNSNNFLEAFGTAQMLIYKKIFEGRLPPGWEPPNMWPFKFSFDAGATE